MEPLNLFFVMLLLNSLRPNDVQRICNTHSTCATCLEYVEELQAYIEEHPELVEITQQVIDGACNELQSPLDSYCHYVVKEYFVETVNEFVEMTPLQVCEAFHVC